MSLAYPFPAAYYKHRWRALRDAEALGVELPGIHEQGDAAFGRYVARIGAALSPASPGYRAWARLAHRPGFGNRAHRKAIQTWSQWTEDLSTGP